jgi:hypothetical protein
MAFRPALRAAIEHGSHVIFLQASAEWHLCTAYLAQTDAATRTSIQLVMRQEIAPEALN